MRGTVREGQSIIELDGGENMRRRRDWVDNDGFIMRDDQLAPDTVLDPNDPTTGPNVPYGPRSRTMLMKMEDDVKKDDLYPFWVALSGAINASLEDFFEDHAAAQRQRQNAAIDEWNRNEMQNLMTNVATKRDQIEQLRDLIYQRELVLDGHVQMNASMRAFRDLSNVMYPNAERKTDFVRTYTNDNAFMRNASYPILRLLANQRIFVRDLCNAILEGRMDKTPQTAANSVASLAGNVVDPDLANLFYQSFTRPREGMIDHPVLNAAFVRADEVMRDHYHPDDGISKRNVVRLIRYLDWYIWLRDEMLTDLPHYTLDFHDPAASRVRVSTASLLDNTLNAAIFAYVVGVVLMKQKYNETHGADVGVLANDGIYTVNQYADIVALMGGGNGGHQWSTFFTTTMGPFMSDNTYIALKKRFASAFTDTTVPSTPGYHQMMADRIPADTIWDHLDQWNTVKTRPLARLMAYVALHQGNTYDIIPMVGTIVAKFVETLPDAQVGPSSKQAVLDMLHSKKSTWSFEGENDNRIKGDLLNGRPAPWDLEKIVNEHDRAYMRTWVDFSRRGLPQATPDDNTERRFAVLTHGGQRLVDIDIEHFLWPWEWDAGNKVPIRGMGGSYASGLRATDDDFSLNYAKQSIPTDILVPVTSGLLPSLLVPLGMPLMDMLLKEDVIRATKDMDWTMIMNNTIDTLFPGMPVGIPLGYRAEFPGLTLNRILNTITNEINADSFVDDGNDLRTIPMGLIKSNFRAYTTHPVMANFLAQGHRWLLPAIVLSAYLSQRSKTEENTLRDEFNTLVKTLDTMEAEYQRMARGEMPDVAKQKKRIRDLVHEPDPTYLMMPMFTGKLPIKPPIVHVVNLALADVKLACSAMRHLCLNDLAHLPADSFLITRFAEYMSAVYALKGLVWPNRFKKDMEYKVNPMVRKNAMNPLQDYRLSADGTLTHVKLPGRWKRIDPVKALVAPGPRTMALTL